MDTQMPPLGEDARKQILTNICENGDAAETDFLEIKGPLDLTKPEGFSKVAKFLLGASNRKPQDAARNFGGYAVLVIGAQKDAAPGVPSGIEPHQLRARIDKYLGQGFPQFMFERLPADQNDHEVLFVLAPPPMAGQPAFPCWNSYQNEAKDRRTKEKDNLLDGAVYIRDGSSTRPAKAAELVALIARGSGRSPVKVELGTPGPVSRVERMDELVEMLYDHEEKTFRDSPAQDLAAPRLPASLRVHAGQKSLSEEQQVARLDLWRSERSDRVATGKARLLGAALPATLLSVVCDRYVSQPRLTVVFQGCEAADWRNTDSLTFGNVVKKIVPAQGFATALTDEFEELPLFSRGHEVQWCNVGEDVEVELSPDSFRPQKTWSIDNDELVIVARDTRAQEVQVTWSLTEEGSDEVTEGKFLITTTDAIDALELVQRTNILP